MMMTMKMSTIICAPIATVTASWYMAHSAPPLGARQRQEVRHPQDVDELLGDDHAAGRDQDLLQVLAVDRLDDDALEEKPEQAGDQHRAQQRRRERGEAGAGDLHQRGGDIGAHRDEQAVREVHHIHQAEDQREPRSHDEDQQPHGEPRDRERDPGRGIADEGERGERDRAQEKERDQVETQRFHWCASSDRPRSRPCSAWSAARAAMLPACTMRPASITATESPSERAAWKFCSTMRIVVVFLSSANAAIRLLMIEGARPLVGSSTSTSFLGSTIAREIDSICFWPPERFPAGRCQNFFSASK